MREEADKLLDASNLYQVLSKYGKVEFTGSYKYDLMLSPDIDIYLVVEEVSKSVAQNLLTELISLGWWNGYLLYDWVKFSSDNHPSFPKSYYVGLKTTQGSLRWKVDIWLVTSEQLKTVEEGWIENSTKDDKIREAILRIKQSREEGLVNTTSHQIYEAVIKDSVRTVDEFKEWLNHNNT